jgi:hypothetical protein
MSIRIEHGTSDPEISPPISISVIGDMDTEVALSLFEQLVAGVSSWLHLYNEYVHELYQVSEVDSSYRASFIHVPSRPLAEAISLHSSVALTHFQQEGKLETTSPSKLLGIIGSLRSLSQTSASWEQAQRVLSSDTDSSLEVPTELLRDGIHAPSYQRAVESGRQLLKNLDLNAEQPYLLANGRVS